MNRASANVLWAAVLLLGIAFAWHVTGQFKQDAAKGYPYAILGFTGILTAMWLVRSVVRMVALNRSGEADTPLFDSAGAILVLAATVVYGIVVVSVGYVIPTVVYMVLVAVILRGRRWLLIAGVSAFFPFTLYFLLTTVLGRPLPF